MIVVAFDHNVTNALIRPENQERILPIRQRAEAGEIEFVATQELIEEASRVVEWSDRETLRLFGGVIGALTQGRHLSTPEWAMQTELLGRAEPFGLEEDRGRVLGYLYRISEGEPAGDVTEIAGDARRKQAEATTRWRADAAEARKKFLALPKAERRMVTALSFPEFDEFEWNAHGRNLAEKHAREAGAENPGEIADRVMADPTSFTYTRRFAAVLNLLKWWWLAKQRAVDDGDQGDARQLTLFPALDHFVTNDAAIREWSRVAGDPAGKVVTFEEFFV